MSRRERERAARTEFSLRETVSNGASLGTVIRLPKQPEPPSEAWMKSAGAAGTFSPRGSLPSLLIGTLRGWDNLVSEGSSFLSDKGIPERALPASQVREPRATAASEAFRLLLT